MDDLEKLRELTEVLPSFNSQKNWSTNNIHVDIEMERGSCVGEKLYEDDFIRVMRYKLSRDAIFKGHQHKEAELVGIYAGGKVVTTPQGDIILRTGEATYFPRNCRHEATYTSEETIEWVIKIKEVVESAS